METIGDIVREMRAHTKGKAEEAWYTPALWARLCDRIEAVEENGYRDLQVRLKALEKAYTKQVEINKELVEENAMLLATHKAHEEFRVCVSKFKYWEYACVECASSLGEAKKFLKNRAVRYPRDFARRIERREVTDWQAIEEVGNEKE